MAHPTSTSYGGYFSRHAEFGGFPGCRPGIQEEARKFTSANCSPAVLLFGRVLDKGVLLPYRIEAAMVKGHHKVQKLCAVYGWGPECGSMIGLPPPA